jgi:transcriptional regulator with XRE-family HTH domain
MASQVATRRIARTDDLARRRFELMALEHLRALGERARQRREELGLTQEEVARRMPGNVSGARVSLWERGKNRPHDGNLEEYAKALETTVAALLTPPADKSRTPALHEVVGESQLDQILSAIRQADVEREDIRKLLSRQTNILNGIERVVASQLSAARRMEEAAALLRALREPPESPDETR